MIGEIVVMPEDGVISMGYTFHYRCHRQGYAYEALTALMDLLHKRYPSWAFVCFTEPENAPSMALLKNWAMKIWDTFPILVPRCSANGQRLLSGQSWRGQPAAKAEANAPETRSPIRQKRETAAPSLFFAFYAGVTCP